MICAPSGWNWIYKPCNMNYCNGRASNGSAVSLGQGQQVCGQSHVILYCDVEGYFQITDKAC